MVCYIKLLVLLPLILTLALAYGKKYKKCPDFDNLANFSKPEELARVQNEVMDNLWATEYPEITDLGEDFQDVLYDLLNSRVPFWRSYALAVSEWIWVYLPDLDKNLDYCSFANIINATVRFENDGNCKTILKSVNTTINEFQVAGVRMIDNIVLNAGCGKGYNVTETPPPQESCYKNGFVYNIEGMWDEIGWEYPCFLKEAVLDLYNSCDKRDKIMALLASAVLSKYLVVFENGYEPALLYKILTMLTYGEVPKYCCKKFIQDTKDITELTAKRKVDSFQLSKNLTGCVN